MTGNMVDLGKYVLKAKSFPDQKSWEFYDRKGFREATGHNILNRPELSHHMDPDRRAAITLIDVLRDVGHYTSADRWRIKSPIIFWAAWENDWLSLPDVIPHLSEYGVKWTLSKVAERAKGYEKLSHWRMNDKDIYPIAKEFSWHLHPAVTGHMRDTYTAKIRQEAPLWRDVIVDSKHPGAVPIGAGLHVRKWAEDILEDEAMVIIRKALWESLGIEIHETDARVASRLKMHCKPDLDADYISDRIEGVLDLSELCGLPLSPFRIARTSPDRIRHAGTRSGDFVRALNACPLSPDYMLEEAVLTVVIEAGDTPQDVERLREISKLSPKHIQIALEERLSKKAP